VAARCELWAAVSRKARWKLRRRLSVRRGAVDARHLRRLQRSALFRFFFDVAAELRERRVAVNLRGFDRRLVLRVDLADPGHRADRIEAEIDELGILVDIAL